MADPETCFGIDLNGLDKNREIFGDQGLLVYFQGSYYSESALEAGALTWLKINLALQLIALSWVITTRENGSARARAQYNQGQLY